MTRYAAEFWIDVGGTFCDCFALMPDGRLLRHKLLSSGVVKGRVSWGEDRRQLRDAARRGDPARHWEGPLLRLLDPAGGTMWEATVERFDHEQGEFGLSEPLPEQALSGERRIGYELGSGEPAPLAAIRRLLRLRLDEPIPPVSLRLGTTRGTNALLTRGGAATALVTTRGFADALLIGDQQRPKLFELAVRKRSPLFERVVEIDERLDAEGRVLRGADFAAIRRQLEPLRGEGIESLAVCLLHAWRDDRHERLVERAAREVGFSEISLSSRVAPLIKLIPRGDTTCLDAYLNPVLRSYLELLAGKLPGSQVRVLTSAGGLIAAERFVGKDSILSGPAGGVVGFSRVAEAAGFSAAIGFDMGGTSTDVSRYDGRFSYEYETVKAGVRVVAPTMAIETVAAGGGSICHFDGVKLCVGPASAGADPGPACYGRGVPTAVTDINLALGKIVPESFPFPLDERAVAARLQACAEQVARQTGTRYEPLELADGFLRIANANMAQAIRSVSIAQGVDPRDYVLVAFGGAAGQHACAVARELGIGRVLNHPDAGLLSAYGIGQAEPTRHAARGVYRPLSEEAVGELEQVFQALAEQCREQLSEEGIAPRQVAIRRTAELRYRGYDAALAVEQPAGEDRSCEDWAAAFAEEHQRLYGYLHAERSLEIVSARVEAIGRGARREQRSRALSPQPRRAARTRTVWFDAEPHEAGLFYRGELKPGERLEGPAIVLEEVATTVVDPGWRADVLSGGELLLTDTTGTTQAGFSAEADPVMLEIFNNHFAGIAEQMGHTLRNTAGSVNVKERLDFSCALFTPAGELVVNAPHIPVHLGAMGETVRHVLRDNPDLRPGDVYVSNDPYRGGSHLPDVTVVTPLHDQESGELLFFTASRAHHAEIGGIVPGSMPPFSKNLAEEGVLIRNFRLVERGRSRADVLRRLLAEAPYPSRNVEENLADIAAQVAANRQGGRDLLRLIDRFTLPVVRAYMGHIQAAAERKTRQALARLPDGRHEFTDHLDDGTPIRVAIDIRGDSARIDFAGTGPVSAGNFNANRAIVTAAVLYCLRCLLQEDIPLNEGVLVPVEIVLPECLLNPPARAEAADCPAVVGGNVETSQRVVDCLLGALQLAAASQGTMNNLLFGDARFGYYETIGGGAGATAELPGADAVHTHMTNTRLTDPEILETRYPVRLHRFAIRHGSGGRGRLRGGSGMVRRIELLRPLEVSLLTQRRGAYRPYGLAGGGAGAAGRNLRIHLDGRTEELPGTAHYQAQAGEILQIETPGGGGYGDVEESGG